MNVIKDLKIKMKNVLFVFILLHIASCGAQKVENTEDYFVVNSYLNQLEGSIVLDAKMLNHENLKPIDFFNGYISFSKKFKDLNDSKSFFNNNEIERLKRKYPDWENEKWNVNLLNDNIQLINEEDSSVSSKNSTINKLFTISKPFYNFQKNKAIILVNTSFLKTKHGGNISIVLMKKTNNEWKYFGNAPY